MVAQQLKDLYYIETTEQFLAWFDENPKGLMAEALGVSRQQLEEALRVVRPPTT